MSAVALVRNQIDRSRLSAVRELRCFADAAGLLAAASGAELVIVDLTVTGAIEALASLGDLSVGRIVAYGPHVDRALLASARAAGADEVLSRSQLFGRRLGERLGRPSS